MRPITTTRSTTVIMRAVRRFCGCLFVSISCPLFFSLDPMANRNPGQHAIFVRRRSGNPPLVLSVFPIPCVFGVDVAPFAVESLFAVELDLRKTLAEGICPIIDCRYHHGPFGVDVAPFAVESNGCKTLAEGTSVVIDCRYHHGPFGVDEAPFAVEYNKCKTIDEGTSVVIDGRYDHGPLGVDVAPFAVEVDGRKTLAEEIYTVINSGDDHFPVSIVESPFITLSVGDERYNLLVLASTYSDHPVHGKRRKQ